MIDFIPQSMRRKLLLTTVNKLLSASEDFVAQVNVVEEVSMT